MSAKYLVWRLCDGHSNASTFEAYDHADAAKRAHNNDSEHGPEQVFCVQSVHGDRKVRVVETEREMVPEYTATLVTPSRMKARCSCGAHLFDAYGSIAVHGKCRPCFIREQSAQIDAWQKERA